ncbi:MAG: ripA [Marmoricola sp.]|nr:ripA [Marmoricola sp.]
MTYRLFLSHRLRAGTLLRLLAVAAIAVLGMNLAGLSPASATDACTQGRSASGATVYYCGVWVPSGGVPVYAGTSTGSAVVDHLHTGGTANWFYCSVAGHTASASGFSSTSWARTIGDDAGVQGYVPAVYFSGAENYWNGLPACGGGTAPGGATCTPTTNSAGQVVSNCPIWVPSGGAPIYSSTSTSSTVVDHLSTAGDVNWFFCQSNGSTATAGGYTSSNWAKTIGDNNGATGYVPAVYFAGSQNYWPNLPSCGSTPPAPVPDACKISKNSAGTTVYYCPVWTPSGGVPVYSSPSPTSAVVDHLIVGGAANWFYCSTSGSTATVSGYSSSSWAKTVGDQNGATGYVPAVYYTGASNYWVGLPACSGTTNNNPPPPPSGGGPTSSGSLTCHGVAVPYTSLPALTITLLQKACGLTGTYSFGGGHGPTPGPSYGHYDGQDPRSLHDNTVLGLDCSGFVRYAYYLTTGVDALAGNTDDQWTEEQAMHKVVIYGHGGNVANFVSQLKPGDLLNYGGHIAIYIGNSKQVNAYESGDPYGVTGLSTGDAFNGAGRLW